MEEVPDGVLRGNEKISGGAADGEVGAEVQAKVAGCNVTVDGVLEAGDVGQGNGGVDLGLRGEVVGDDGV